MSTRAAYTFIDREGQDGTHHVYKHHDGYPSGALKAITAALRFAWDLPRFEADEFAAAFVAANKPRHGGGVRLTHDWKLHGDLEFRYEIFFYHETLMISAYDLHNDERAIFIGTFAEFEEWAKEKE